MTGQRREPGSVIEAVRSVRGYTLPVHSVGKGRPPRRSLRPSNC